MPKAFLIPVLLLSAVLLVGCASTDEIPTESAEDIYSKAYISLRNGNYETAIQELRRVQARFPFGEYAIQAHLDLIYAHYLARQPEVCVEEADRFIRENPRHPHVHYAYYMKGLAYFSEPNFLHRTFGIDLARRDPSNARRAFQNFRVLTETFPDSAYAEDARQRMIFLRNHLARHEFYVADYYLRRGAYIAAVNRAKRILENYPSTPSTPDALRIMIKSYEKMGLDDLARDARLVFETSYPELPLEPVDDDSGWFSWLKFWD